MDTNHRIIIDDASDMAALEKDSIDLVVTSPPYPMIQMWDDLFGNADPEIENALTQADADTAFHRMHLQLDLVWKELRRVVKPGGMVCINIGDATRTIGDRFRLFANHARIIMAFQALGFDQLPSILWRKPTNAPNKFMGSGMLPPNAYVTLEHEYILNFRLGTIRDFPSDELRRNRRSSAIFWEERNIWFSDVWFDLIGTQQKTNNNDIRQRSAAFPFELPYRLINMFSVKGDTVLDPFIGTGTTMLAAMASARNCVGYEKEAPFQAVILEKITDLQRLANQMIQKRMSAHCEFIRHRTDQNKTIKNHNAQYDLPVITKQESDLSLELVKQVYFSGSDRIRVSYKSWKPCEDDQWLHQIREGVLKPLVSSRKGRQLKLF